MYTQTWQCDNCGTQLTDTGMDEAERQHVTDLAGGYMPFGWDKLPIPIDRHDIDCLDYCSRDCALALVAKLDGSNAAR